MNTELKILLDSHLVRKEIQAFLISDDVQCASVSQFACIATKEEDLVVEVLNEAGLDKVKLQDKVAIRAAWHAARGAMGSGAAGASSSASSSTKMPDGAEVSLRTAWKALHNFNISGGWLVNEDLMTRLYRGLMATPKYLYVPDMSSIGRRSALSQKPLKGTFITDHGIENMDITLNPCTTHPDIWLRIRAFVMTICWLSCMTPDWFSYETAVEVVDFIFEAINLRPDGKRPSLECITQCFLTMWSEFAKCLQNEKVVLESWLREKSSWHHFWKESIVSFDQIPAHGGNGPDSSTVFAASASLPADVNSMVHSNNSLLRSMQQQQQRQIQSLTDRVGHQKQGGGGGRGAGNGGGAKKKGAGKRDRSEYENDAGKKKGGRLVTDGGRTVFNRRSKRGKQ